jgi:hypothetical protein
MSLTQTTPAVTALAHRQTVKLSAAEECTPNGAMVAEMSALQQHGMLPNCETFQVNSRLGWVTLDLASLTDLKVWADALGIKDREPDRYLYPEDRAIRWNLRYDDPASGWRFDLNTRLFLGLAVDNVMLDLNEDTADAIEMVLEGGA